METSATLELVLETSSTMELVNNVMELVNNFLELVLETSSTMELVNNMMELLNNFLELVFKNFRNGACKQFFGACKQCALFGTRALGLARALSQLPKRATRMGWRGGS